MPTKNTHNMKSKDLTPPYSPPLAAKELADRTDSEIDFSDIPPVGKDFWDNAVLMRPEDWKKQRLAIRLDVGVIEFFKSQGPTWQIRMNEVLRAHVEAMRK
jgi:uncharacterized protein (DUF4415 family)